MEIKDMSEGLTLMELDFPLSCKDGSTFTHMQMYCSILTEWQTKTMQQNSPTFPDKNLSIESWG